MANAKALSDEALVELIIKDDQELFAEIVTRYQDKLERYITRLGSSKEQSQDIVQDTFIKSYKNLRSFNPKFKFSSWIYRIAHNEAVNLFKKESKYQKFSFSDWLSEVLPSSSNVEEEVGNKIDLEQLKKKLDKLDLKYKEVLILYYLEEKKYAEISKILKIPTSTVGIRLKRAKKQFKKLCQPQR
ncbi:MAG: RNA polymerase sigma factor [Candidatus Pacebacteria bacterium]|nr:RNA polymerase sigma factor [Candidatus Paceibacterota bacterium]